MFAFLTQASAGDPLGTWDSVRSLLSRVIPPLSSVVFSVVTGANSKGEDTEAGFWKLVPPHFLGSALWLGSGASSGVLCALVFHRAVSVVEALQIRGHTACRAGLNSAVAETALTSTPRSRLRPLRSFPMHFLLLRG